MWQGGQSADRAQEAGLKSKAGASEQGVVILVLTLNHQNKKKSKLSEPQFLLWKICLRTIC